MKLLNLFPTTCAFITFLLYIFLFIFHGVFITASLRQGGGGYKYNTTLVILISEGLKLLVSAVLYSMNKGCKPHLLRAILKERKLALLYFIPSILYCLYNNLSFVNLAHYDPTTYYILLQFRVVITALLFQCLFNKTLSKVQWISLIILTAGCMIKNLNIENWSNNLNPSWTLVFNSYTILVLVQSFCSCLAGTYNEYLLKNQGIDVDIFLQNVFMYMDSIVCNAFVILLRGDTEGIVSGEAFFSLLNVFVILVIVVNAAVGIVTSFFLKNLNSILKTYASALELILTAIVCYIIFDIPITFSTVISIFVISIAVVLYFRNPVKNPADDNGEDKKALMGEDV